MKTVSVLDQRWYVVVNDLTGGYDVSNVDLPASQANPYTGQGAICWGVQKDVAEQIVELHNTWLNSKR